MSVNLSARSNFSDELVEGVQALLNRHGVPAETLILEITESSVIKDPARTGEVLDRLHALGVGLSLDDFGTGYSSMSYLRQLPVQEVKIDKSFVMTMLSSPEDAAIVRSVVDLGNNLGLVVVAEGVEDLATWQELERLGCENMQASTWPPRCRCATSSSGCPPARAARSPGPTELPAAHRRASLLEDDPVGGSNLEKTFPARVSRG